MSLNETPRGNRVHIALFGRTNAGKSSLINALTNQKIALVSEVKGTTTDPVYKAMELLPIGPVVIIDTAGLDDTSNLGDLRREKTYEVLHKTEIALLVIDATMGLSEFESEIIAELKAKNIPIILVFNKIDLLTTDNAQQLENLQSQLNLPIVKVSTITQSGINDLKHEIIKALPNEEDKFRLVGDLIHPGDLVVLVIPIDKAAPKGRLILPQQQVIRDVLESDAICIVTKEYELKETLENLKQKPKLVITDSQVFLKVSADTPPDIWLTSFSILFARYKGDLNTLVMGAKAVKALKDGDKVLIAEGCTHHRQSDDIGTVKIPRWLRSHTGKQLNFEFSSGYQYPEQLEDYALIIHCGACMLNNKEVNHRIQMALDKGVPIVNYGVLIAYLHGVFERALQPFPLARLAYEE